MLILFWLKPYHPYPKTIRKCIVMHSIHFLCCVCFVFWDKITAGVFYLQLNTVGWSSHMTSLERMSCLGDHDICSTSVPCITGVHVHGLDLGLFGSGLRLLPTGSGVRFSSGCRCQAKFLTYYCLSVILLLRAKE